MTHSEPAAEPHDEAPREEPGRRRGGFVFLRDLAIIVVAALVISFVVKTFLIRSFFIPSGSMEQTLQVNDRIIVNQLVPEVVDLSRGDVVVFEDPGGWLSSPPADDSPALVRAVTGVLQFIGVAPSDTNEHLIKRVIGLPGDTVECCDSQGRLLVNDEPIDEAYVHHALTGEPASATGFSVIVPDDALWVLGDNRENSEDSRYHGDTPTQGFVPIENVVGRAVLITWPLERWSWIDNYPQVFEAVPAS